MAFWSDPSSLFPKQSHRWVISFGEEKYSVPHYFIKSIDRPSFEIGSVQAKYLYSHTFNFPKRTTWKPIKAEFNDVMITSGNEIVPVYSESMIDKDNYRKSTQSFFYSMLTRSGYTIPSEATEKSKNLRFKTYTFKQNLSLALRGEEFSRLSTNQRETDTEWDVTIKELDENGNLLEAWNLYNPFISDVTFNKLDYSNDNVLSISATIIYDWAELEAKSTKENNKKPPAPTVPEQKSKDKKPVLPGIDADADLSKPVSNAGKSVVPTIREYTVGTGIPMKISESQKFQETRRYTNYIPGYADED